MNSVDAVLVTPAGEFQPVVLNRPVGGGLEVIAGWLECKAIQTELVTLKDWLQVWVNSDLTDSHTPNPALSRMMTSLTGQEQAVAGAGLFCATVPHRWEIIGVNASQLELLKQTWVG